MRSTSDFTGVIREGGWAVGCVAAAFGFCYLVPEYGYSPVSFFSVVFYVLTGAVRIGLRLWRDR